MVVVVKQVLPEEATQKRVAANLVCKRASERGFTDWAKTDELRFAVISSPLNSLGTTVAYYLWSRFRNFSRSKWKTHMHWQNNCNAQLFRAQSYSDAFKRGHVRRNTFCTPNKLWQRAQNMK